MSKKNIADQAGFVYSTDPNFQPTASAGTTLSPWGARSTRQSVGLATKKWL